MMVCLNRTKARTTKTFMLIACGLFNTLPAMMVPCLVKTQCKYVTFWPRFKITDCALERINVTASIQPSIKGNSRGCPLLRAAFSPAHPLADIFYPPYPPIASQSISRDVPLARASTFLSCAFCEQEGHLATPSHPSKLVYFTSLGMALVVVQLRTSSEHIPIVRAPGARDHASVIPFSPLESSF
jgi:hypothetical protein